MSLLNKPNCGGVDSIFNIGAPICDLIRGIPLGLIFTDGGVVFNEGELASAATFVAAVKSKTLAARGGRVYPMWTLTNYEDTSKESTKIALGNLTNAEITGVEGVPSFSFQHRQGELFHKALIKAGSQNLRVLIVDNQYAVYGTESAGGGLQGFTMAEFKAGLAKFGTPSTASNYPFSITLSSIVEYHDNLAFMLADQSITSASGLVSVTLKIASTSGTGVKVQPVALGNSNLTDMYSTELAEVTAWVVTDAAGAPVTISAVAYDAGTQSESLTLGAEYTGATSGAVFTVGLAAPSVLAAAPINVDGYDGISTTFEKP